MVAGLSIRFSIQWDAGMTSLVLQHALAFPLLQ